MISLRDNPSSILVKVQVVLPNDDRHEKERLPKVGRVG
jgi:hypothetical protein